MKKIIFAMLALLLLGTTLCSAQSVKRAKMERGDNFLFIDFDLAFEGMKVKSNRAVLLTPVIVNGSDTIRTLHPVGVYGRNRYYHYLRNGRSSIGGPGEQSFAASAMPDSTHYHTITDYDPRMEGASLMLRKEVYGCCDGMRAGEGDVAMLVDNFTTPVVEPRLWVPALAYVRPEGESVKERKLSGSAFIDFPVNRTEIYPDYRNNIHELIKITATIDSIRRDKDIQAKSLAVKGFASPEGSYKNNERLAQGRTESLRKYVQELYHFPAGFIGTSYEPEDWDGLRRYVESSDLSHRDEILAKINASGDPDKKEAGIKSAYPEEYDFLLKNVYPGLRHTDYTIEYIIRSYSNVDDIRRVMKENPQKLSLNELYLLAQSYEVGSAEFVEVFEMAVRLFPDDEAANLNAANTALARLDLDVAARYLSKAGASPEAVYARGVHAFLSRDIDTARTLIRQAAEAGVKEAAETWSKME